MSDRGPLFLFNDSTHYGGAEVYTHFFGQALAHHGYDVVLLMNPQASFWQRLQWPGVRLQPIGSLAEVERHVPADALFIAHNGPPIEWLRHLKRRGTVVGMAHHPPNRSHVRGRAEQSSLHPYYAESNLLLTVSEHVLNACHAFGYRHTYPVPLLGIGDLVRGVRDEPIVATSPYEWDARKGRDRLLERVYPLYRALQAPRRFERRPGLTLGVVSRIAHIKQLDALFALLAPRLRRFDAVHLEIFGAGKYSLVRDLARALRPLRGRVRYWGWQWNVAAIYPQLDYLMTGLPEREALGLNVIEAQFCGTPVLAPRAPPFTETVLDGRSGFLYRDPREDAGADFERLVQRLVRQELARPEPLLAREHLAQFQFPAFAARVLAAVEYARARLLDTR